MTAHTYMVPATLTIRILGSGVNERVRSLETVNLDMANPDHVTALESLGIATEEDMGSPVSISVQHRNPFALTPDPP